MTDPLSALIATDRYFAEIKRKNDKMHALAVLNTEIMLDVMAYAVAQVQPVKQSISHFSDDVIFEERTESATAMPVTNKPAGNIHHATYGRLVRLDVNEMRAESFGYDGKKRMVMGMPDVLNLPAGSYMADDEGSHPIDKSRDKETDVLPNNEAKSLDYFDGTLDDDLLGKRLVQGLRKSGGSTYEDIVDRVVDKKHGDVEDRFKVESMLEDLALFGIAYRYADNKQQTIYILNEG